MYRRVFLVITALFWFGSSALASPRLSDGIDAVRVADDLVINYGHDWVLVEGCDDPITAGELQPIAADFRLKIFLNFDGAKLSRGGSDSRTNKTSLILSSTLDFPALEWTRFGGRDKGLKDVIDELKLLYNEYSVEFVTERPKAGDYTMAMIGGIGNGVKKGSPGTVGISPLDCKNRNRNDVAIVFGQRLSSARKLALVIAHELGHSFGLEHVSDKKGIMYPALNGQTCCWVDSGLAQRSICGRKKQDSKQVLVDNLGAGPGDTIVPLVWFIRPGAGALLPPNFSFEAGAADDLRVHHVALYVDGEKKAELNGPPYVVALKKMSDGQHTLKVEVFDWKPNKVSAEITVTVDARCPAEGTCYLGTAGLGGECSRGGDCTSKRCAKKDGKGVCVGVCAEEKGSCPAGNTCQKLAEGWACVSSAGWTLDTRTYAGGCAMASRASDEALLPLLFLLIIGVIARRRGSPPSIW